jgi:hypothetical protein
MFKPLAEKRSEHHLPSKVTSTVSLETQRIRERAQICSERTPWSLLWHKQQDHLIVDAVSHGRLLSPRKWAARSQDYIESITRVCRKIKDFTPKLDIVSRET